jgi:transposase
MARRKHGVEFKRKAVKLAQQPGTTKTQVAKDLGIHISVLRHWIRQFEAGKWEATPGKGLRSEQQLEIERLRRQLRQAETERDILKKAVAYFAKEPK